MIFIRNFHISQISQSSNPSRLQNNIFLYIVGLLVFSVPFLGIPESWKTIILFVSGASVLIGAFSSRITMRRLEWSENEYCHEENKPEEVTENQEVEAEEEVFE